jgi:hypothetical protein
MSIFRPILIFIFLPLIGFSQMNRIQPGMSVEELRKLYPGLVPDLQGMTSNIYGDDSIPGIPGKGTWIIIRDTVRSYQFASKDVVGPCENFPNDDSAARHLLMKKASELSRQYEAAFGKATLTAAPKNSVGSKYLYYREWDLENDEIILAVLRPSYGSTEDANVPNAPPVRQIKYGCYYKLSISAKGKGKQFRENFGVDVSKGEFRKKHPKLASQVQEFPDKWTMRDTLMTNYGTWRFSFEKGKLTSFTLDIYDGAIYKNQTEQAYAILLDRCRTLTKEARKNYGKPTDIAEPSSDKYKKRDLKNYYSEIDYQATWSDVKGKRMVIRLGETGGGKQGAPVFHLEVIYPAAG